MTRKEKIIRAIDKMNEGNILTISEVKKAEKAFLDFYHIKGEVCEYKVEFINQFLGVASVAVTFCDQYGEKLHGEVLVAVNLADRRRSTACVVEEEMQRILAEEADETDETAEEVETTAKDMPTVIATEAIKMLDSGCDGANVTIDNIECYAYCQKRDIWGKAFRVKYNILIDGKLAEVNEIPAFGAVEVIAQAIENVRNGNYEEVETCAHCGELINERIETEDGTIFCSVECAENAGYVMCDNCDKWEQVEDMINIDGEYYCSSECAHDCDYQECNWCGEWHSCYDSTIVGDSVFCSDRCAERAGYVECYECGEWFDPVSCGYEATDGNQFCSLDCVERADYNFCDDCGELFPYHDLVWNEYEERNFCQDCAVEHEDILHEYSFTPDTWEYVGNPANGRYFGLEIETNLTSGIENISRIEEQVWACRDGSIDGAEFKFTPTSREEWEGGFFRQTLSDIIHEGGRSHNAFNTGLHIHVSRDGISDDFREVHNICAKCAVFLHNNWNDVIRFTRRDRDRIAQYANDNLARTNHDADTFDGEKGFLEVFSKKFNVGNRYVAINMRNSNTVEFRIFRGTLKHSTVLASIQFVDLLLDICKETDGYKWYTFTFSTLVDYARKRGDSAEFINYCMERGIV